MKIPNIDGLKLMSRIKEIDSNAVVIMMPGNADIDNALASLKLGEFDYLTKPLKVDQLMSALNRASELVKVNVATEEHDSSIALLGDSAAAQKLKERVSQIADSHSPALMKGRCGVQKSVLVVAIHHAQFAEEAASRDCKYDVIQPADLPNRIEETDKWPNLADFTEQASEEYKTRIPRTCLGNPKKASAILGCEISDIS